MTMNCLPPIPAKLLHWLPLRKPPSPVANKTRGIGCEQDGRHDTVFRSISKLDPPDYLHSHDRYAAHKSSKV